MNQTFKYILNISIYTMNNLRDDKGKNYFPNDNYNKSIYKKLLELLIYNNNNNSNNNR